MDTRDLQTIRQRIAEGYYRADAEALTAMRLLLDTVHRFRDDDAMRADELTPTLPRSWLP
jgi:hypothetical protein